MIDKLRQLIADVLTDFLSLFSLKDRQTSNDDADSEVTGEKGSQPVWCLIANVVEERKFGVGGAEVKKGLKQLQPGAKVHCFPLMWGDGYDNVQVVARQRKSHRYMTIIVRSEHLTNSGICREAPIRRHKSAKPYSANDFGHLRGKLFIADSYSLAMSGSARSR
jgi:hypothetical protein